MKLEVINLTAGYGRADVLHEVTLEVAVGEIIAIVGSNGAGKSTLVKSIAGQLPVRSGQILDDGDDVSKSSSHVRARNGITLVPEGRRLFGSLTVEENLQLGRHASRNRTRDRESIDSLIDSLNDSFPILHERRHERTGLLSGGQQQMVALARAAASRPRYLLLDEPSLGLSPRLTTEVFRLVKDIASSTGAGVILVEQMADRAIKLAARTYVLEQGVVVASGDSADLLNSDVVRKAYLGS